MFLSCTVCRNERRSFCVLCLSFYVLSHISARLRALSTRCLLLKLWKELSGILYEQMPRLHSNVGMLSDLVGTNCLEECLFILSLLLEKAAIQGIVLYEDLWKEFSLKEGCSPSEWKHAQISADTTQRNHQKLHSFQKWKMPFLWKELIWRILWIS